jgi:hypothetical protein
MFPKKEERIKKVEENSSEGTLLFGSMMKY